MTQQEFADRIKVKRNTVATYELGRSEPSDAAISLICKEFKVNERWLRTGERELFLQMTRDEEIAAVIGGALAKETDSFKKRFISMLARLKESDWEVLERMVAGIKKD